MSCIGVHLYYYIAFLHDENNAFVSSSLFVRLDEWGLGKKRSFAQYMNMVGIDTVAKKVTPNKWCHQGDWPAIALPYKLDKKEKR